MRLATSAVRRNARWSADGLLHPSDPADCQCTRRTAEGEMIRWAKSRCRGGLARQGSRQSAARGPASTSWWRRAPCRRTLCGEVFDHWAGAGSDQGQSRQSAIAGGWPRGHHDRTAMACVAWRWGAARCCGPDRLWLATVNPKPPKFSVKKMIAACLAHAIRSKGRTENVAAVAFGLYRCLGTSRPDSPGARHVRCKHHQGRDWPSIFYPRAASASAAADPSSAISSARVSA